jgi:hypothetical protein
VINQMNANAPRAKRASRQPMRSTSFGLCCFQSIYLSHHLQ